MNIKLEVIKVNEDVISTSALCSYQGYSEPSTGSFKYTGESSNQYWFYDGNWSAGKNTDSITAIIDANGNNKGNIAPQINTYYHVDLDDGYLYECKDSDHHGTFPVLHP